MGRAAWRGGGRWAEDSLSAAAALFSQSENIPEVASSGADGCGPRTSLGLLPRFGGGTGPPAPRPPASASASDPGDHAPHFIPVPGEQRWVYVFI